MGLAKVAPGQAGDEKVVGSQVGEEIDPAVLGGDVGVTEELASEVEFAEVDELSQVGLQGGQIAFQLHLAGDGQWFGIDLSGELQFGAVGEELGLLEGKSGYLIVLGAGERTVED